MNDNENGNGLVDGWWAASSDADHEQTVTLRRRENGSEPLLDRFTVSPETMPSFEDFEFSVKERFGGGLYVAVIAGQRGQFGKKIPFAIAGLPKREATPDEGRSQGNGLEGLAAILMKNQEASESRMMAVMERLADKPAAPDAFDMFDKVAGILGRTGATPVPQKSLVEQMQELRQGAELMGLTGKPEGDEGSGWAKDLFAAFAPVAAGMMTQGGGGADIEHDPETPAADPQANALHMLRVLLVSMVQLAEFEVTTEKAVEGITRKAGAHWPMLEQVIQRPDALALAAQMVPAVAEHQEWFENFRTFVMTGGKKETSNGTTGGKQAARKKPAASGQPGAAVKRGSRNTANAAANG